MDVVIGVFVEPAATRCAVDENDLRQGLIGVTFATAAGSGEPVHQIAIRKDLPPNRGIEEVRKVRQENTVVVVVQPAYVRGVHSAEDCGR